MEFTEILTEPTRESVKQLVIGGIYLVKYHDNENNRNRVGAAAYSKTRHFQFWQADGAEYYHLSASDAEVLGWFRLRDWDEIPGEVYG